MRVSQNIHKRCSNNSPPMRIMKKTSLSIIEHIRFWRKNIDACVKYMHNLNRLKVKILNNKFLLE